MLRCWGAVSSRSSWWWLQVGQCALANFGTFQAVSRGLPIWPQAHMRLPTPLVSAIAAATLTAGPFTVPPAIAEPDCYNDCSSNYNRLAPKSGKYCEQTCGEYCAQDDRRDGLSGSVSNEAAELGLASGFDIPAKLTGQQPRGVVYGDDRPPAISLGKGFDGALKRAVLGRGEADR